MMIVAAVVTVWATLKMMREKWMKFDETTQIMAAGDISRPQTAAGASTALRPKRHALISRSADEGNRPITSAEWAAISKYQLDTCQRKVFCCQSSTFQNIWICPNERLIPYTLPPHLILFILPQSRGKRSAATNSLSDEGDKWQRCFGSGDTVLAKECVFAQVCICVCWRDRGGE